MRSRLESKLKYYVSANDNTLGYRFNNIMDAEKFCAFLRKTVNYTKFEIKQVSNDTPVKTINYGTESLLET